MTRPTPPRTIPAPWSGAPDAWCELNARRMRAQWEREERAERRYQRMVAARFYAVVAAAILLSQVGTLAHVWTVIRP